MGTNFYAVIQEKPACSACGREADVETIHIGKRSGGWVFGFHAVPAKGLISWADWHKFLAGTRAVIENEYHDVLTLSVFAKEVYATLKDGARRHTDHYPGPSQWLDGEGFDFGDHEFS